MTLEELKAEAARQGFELRKAKPKEEKVAFVPCVCGCLRHHEWVSNEKLPGERFWRHLYYYECVRCHIKSKEYAGGTKNAARAGWNKMIEERRAKNGEKG